MHDYYSILGVHQNDKLEDIKKAYRIRAFEYHPDRGGSHEKMLLINEAWLILSNPTTRSHYDTARANINNEEAQKTARKEAQNSQQKAQEYPRKWDDFERWFNANYGTTSYAMGLKVPTGGNSAGRWLFILGGAFLGILLAANIIESQHIRSGAAGIAIPLSAGGAWLGVVLHYMMSKK